MMKKKLSLFTAIVMSLSAVCSSVNAAFTDVPEDYSYKKAITTLSKLNVINGYDDGTFAPNNDITRAEFTKLIVYMLGYGDISTKITRFEDVSSEHWANANIATAYDLGIINGFSDTIFAPDSPVTYEQALKMLVCALGYQASAEAQGGYPDGYISEAVSLNLTDKVNGAAYTDNATRGLVAQIMYNSLEVDMMEKNGNKYVSADKNLLNDYLDTYIVKGTVVGVEDSITAECDATLYPGQIAIDDDKTGEEYVMDYTQYTASLSDMTSYLGKTIQVYYRKDKNTSDKWLIDIDSETYQNKEITISSYDIDSLSGNTLKYYPENSGKTSSLKLDKSDLTIRYNGRVVDSNVTLGDNTYTPEDALNEWLDSDSKYFIYGTARLIDSGSKGNYNIIDIYDYDTIVAYAAPTSPDYRITDKTVTGNYLTLNPDSSDYKFTLKKNGSEIATTSIAANDVINYALNLDGDYYTAYATASSVSGTITNINTGNNNEQTISIDGTEYHISDRFINYIENKDQKKLETGVQITAYKDMFGTLEWGTITKSSTYYPYAYVITAEQDGEDYYLKLFAPTSTTMTTFSSSSSYKVQSFKLTDNNIKLNTKKSSPDSVISALAANAESANPDKDIANIKTVYTGYNQLIRVGFNSSGEISDIITMDTADDGKNNDDNSSLVRYKSMDSSAKYYVSASSVKASSTGTTYYSLKSSTPMFVIPKDRTDTNSYSLKSAITSNTMTAGSSYYLDAYDVSDTKYPSCLLVYNTNFKSGTAITLSTAYRLIYDDVKEEYDETEGDVFNMLYTYNSATTQTKTKIASDALSLFNSIGKGDIILNGTDSDKHADSIMKAIDYDDIQKILNGETTTVYDEDGNVTGYETYNWTKEQEQTSDNYYQKYTYDFRYPKNSIITAVSNGEDPSDSDLKNYWLTGGNVTNISSRAFMVNVMQVLTDENTLYVTRDGFDESGNLNENNYMEIKINSSTKYMRYDSDKKEFTPYAQGTESTALTAQDLKEAKNYGNGCSKVLITYVSGTSTASTSTPTAKFIVIYE